MSISKFFTTTFTAKRMTWVGDDYSELATVPGFNGHLQQTEAVMAESLGMKFTETFTIWCAIDTAVQRDDRINSGGVNYTVKFVQELLVGIDKHLQLVVEKMPKDYD